MTEFKHFTVMKKEATDALNLRDGLVYVDATLGGGGHSEVILKAIPNGKLIAFDIDDDAINSASEKLKYYKNLTIIKDSYTNIKKVLQKIGIKKITGGVLIDLGASYHQLTCPQRGFSFMYDAPLDMRFGSQIDKTASDIVNSYSENDLVRIFSEYGEERFSKRIAKAIVEKRLKNPIKTTKELADLIIEATPKIKSKIHPATRVFQALRIEVNRELTNIDTFFNDVLDLLDNGAIISAISFHSLEDRIVKRFFKYHSQKCHCDKTQMICHCPPPKLELVTKKPIIATEEELKINPPSRSAKLRVAKRINVNNNEKNKS
ncbi:16S rRNA (cytosine(1402)-N(4))-methyltransferase RsmH [bacterium]|nr:16S rRNA (cytosine(1402)-N(4))-methyltransferase RsmH [bacterium]